MGKASTFLHLLKTDRRGIYVAAFNNLAHTNLFNNMSDKRFLEIAYRVRMGKKLDLNNPKTFNEKLQWLKLYDRNPKYTDYVDKYRVRSFVAETIGEEYLIPLLGVWDHAYDIDFDSLPDQFVLKCNHDSGSIMICKDKEAFDRQKAVEWLEGRLSKTMFYLTREWPYKNVKPRVVAEAYMEDPATSELRDYKFFCFDGEVKALFIAEDRQVVGEDTKFDFFDADYNHLEFTNGHPNAKKLPEKPVNFELMKELASKLSAGIPHVRVDFYECNGKVFFGDMTFAHWSGMVPFEPEKWDRIFGAWIKLPEKKA